MPTKHEKLLLTLTFMFVVLSWTVTVNYPSSSVDLSSIHREATTSTIVAPSEEKSGSPLINDKVSINSDFDTNSTSLELHNNNDKEEHEQLLAKTKDHDEKPMNERGGRKRKKKKLLFFNGKEKVTNFIPPTGTGVLTRPLDRRCCMIWLSENAGHALTEVPFQLARCSGPVVSIDYSPFAHFNQIVPFVDLFRKTNTTTQECFDYYNYYPEQHPTKDFAFAFATMALAHNLTYDAYEVGRNLRVAQKKILSSCGLKSPVYDHEIPNNAKGMNNLDGRKYESVSNRNPSKSIIILVRKGRRVLRNAQEILPICQELHVSCKIIYMEKYWNQPETNDLCYILKTFEDALIISMQGAELVYPLYLGSRQLLISFRDKQISASDVRHYGKANPEEREVEILPNLVEAKNTYNGGLDSFFPDFALHLGSELTIVHGKMLNPYDDEKNMNKADEIKNSSNCIPKRKGYKGYIDGIKNYCLDMEVDLDEVKSVLQQQIADGSLLQVVNNTKTAVKTL